MVQGKTKELQAKSPAAASRHSARAAAATKKGLRNIPPKKTILVKQAQMHKSLTAKINKSIERQMVDAASSGKLTIMRHSGPEASSSKAKSK